MPRMQSENLENYASPTFGDDGIKGANNPLNPEQEFQEYFVRLENWINEFKNYFQSVTISNIINLNNIQSTDTTNRYNQDPRLQSDQLETDHYEVQLAPLWKRFFAEFIDGLILFFIKFYIIIILHDGFDISWKNYLNYVENASVFFNFSPEIAIVEFISRLLIFAYESYFLSMNYATPGKKILGLKVVIVDVFLEVPGRSTLCVSPCTRLGWWRAFIRSVLKNLGVFVFPICYGILFTNSPRAGYDYITKTMVIDTARHPMRVIPRQNRPNVFNNGPL